MALTPRSLTASVHALQAVLSFWHGRLDAAVSQVDLALDHSALLGMLPWLHDTFDFFGAIIYESAGQQAAADRALARMHDT